jgi:hypothetical protein
MERIMPSKWMVDVVSMRGESGEAEMKEAIESLDFAKLIESQGGLAASIQAKIVEYGYRITDRGGGCNSWHIGVPFDELDEAVEYLKKLTVDFRAAIAMGMIQFELKTWTISMWQ